MHMPDANHILRTAAAELVMLSFGALAGWLVHYLYGLDLLNRMLHLFPDFSGIGLIGFILIPIIVLFMLVWAAICVLFVLGLLLFWVSITVGVAIIAIELAINLFADPARRRDPLELIQARLRGIELAASSFVRRALGRFLP